MPYPLATSSPDIYVGVGKQGAKGTPSAPSVFVPYRAAPSLDHGMAGDEVFEAGTGPYPNRSMKTAHDPNGSFGLGARPATIAKLIAWFLGADAVATSGSLWNHTATPHPSNRTWLSIEQAAGVTGDIVERFTDAVLTKLQLTVDGNQDVMAALGWSSLAPAYQATAATPTYESGVVGSTPGAPYRAAGVTYTVDGSAETNLATFDLNLEWSYDGPRLAAVTRADLLKLSLTGTVKVKQLLNSTQTRDAYRKINYGSAASSVAAADFFGTGAVVATITNGLTTTNERSLIVTLPNIDWKMAKYTDLDPAGATMYVEREGVLKKLSGAELVTMVSKTADSAAY